MPQLPVAPTSTNFRSDEVMQTDGSLALAGVVSLDVRRGTQLDRSATPARELTTREILRYGLPSSASSPEVNEYRVRNLPNLWRGARRVAAARTLGIATLYGALSLLVVRGSGERVDLGLVSMRVVTNNGVGYIVDAFQNLVELENMKFHGFGTGTNNEASADAALQTEFTTEYATDDVRPTGTTAEAAANIYQTVATFAPDSGGTLAVTEHGVFSQAATGGGVLLDRSKFAAVNVAAGADSIVASYALTLTAGG